MIIDGTLSSVLAESLRILGLDHLPGRTRPRVQGYNPFLLRGRVPWAVDLALDSDDSRGTSPC